MRISGIFKRLQIATLCLSFSLVAFPLSGKEQSKAVKSDTSSVVLLDAYESKLALFEKQRVEDSVKRSQLETQLMSLKSADNAKKEVLQKQLLELQTKEKDRIAQKKAQIASLRLKVKGFPVAGLFNDTLFYVYSRLGSFSAKDRANAISERIRDLGSYFMFRADSLKVSPSETTVDISFGDKIILSVSENDALWNDTTQTGLAQKYQQIIANEVIKYHSETSFGMLAKQIGMALLVLIVVFTIIYFIRRGTKFLVMQIIQKENTLIKEIKIKGYVLFDAKRQIRILLRTVTILKWILILLVIYIALPIIFSIFPWTKGVSTLLFGYILNPVKHIAVAFWNYLPKLVTILVILFIFRYILKGLGFLKNEVEKGNLRLPGFYPDWANPTYQIIRMLILAFLVIVIFPYLPGSESPIFRGVSVFLGFLLTFGSSGSLSNIISGLVITYMRLFKIGDRVKIGDVVGDVIEKSLLVTRIRTIKNEIISIPNSTVMSSHSINYSSDAPDKGLILHTTVTIGYDVPWKDMHQALIDAALRTNLILKEPKPFVLQTSLDDFYVSYQINGYTKAPQQMMQIYSELHQNIQDVCNERGIEIMSPHYHAQRDGNLTSIPEQYWADDYEPPTFKVTMDQKGNIPTGKR
ncbi:mechanosensitive ion channel family protein [Microbacter margulisiae]|uniref:Small-conductance mechanosensitive channel n=1 Tax=Microbacter margulisiae TaxID=1350067 RepID=A0A7W5DPB7_9PORP|nr:mechanosensitive ion channel family protein [Microbacter margulisiae]MBB3186595.1 small-conductance mechanosensitive channel [Microbacter margulisiae]